MSRPRIALDATPFETSHPTGVERLWRGAIRALAARDDAVDVVLVSRAPIEPPCALPERFSCHVVGSAGTSSRAWRERELPRALDALDIDLLHGPFAAIPRGGAFRRIATVHEVSWKHAPFAEGLTHAIRHRRHLRRLARIADRVLTPSERTRSDCIDYRCSLADRVVAVHPGIEPVFRVATEDDVERDRAVLRRLGIASGSAWLLSVGALRAAAKKDPGYLLDIAARVSERCGRDVPIVFAGDPGDRRSALERAARRAGATAVFTGFVDDTELAALYRGATAYVHASRSEGFGFPLVEAMACGTPVVAVDAGSVVEVCGGAAVEPSGREGFVGSVTRLVNDAEARDDLRRRGLERASAFSWSRFGEALQSLYLAALEEPARS